MKAHLSGFKKSMDGSLGKEHPFVTLVLDTFHLFQIKYFITTLTNGEGFNLINKPNKRL